MCKEIISLFNAKTPGSTEGIKGFSVHVVKFCEPVFPPVCSPTWTPLSVLFRILRLPSTSVNNWLPPVPRRGDGLLGAITRMLFRWPSGRHQRRRDLHGIRSNARERLEILFKLSFLHAMQLFSYHSIEIQKEAEA